MARNALALASLAAAAGDPRPGGLQAMGLGTPPPHGAGRPFAQPPLPELRGPPAETAARPPLFPVSPNASQ